MTRSFRSIAALAGCTAAALLTACGPSTGLPADIASCASPKAICMATASATPQCIDLSSDVNNCGTCGNVCGVPQQGGTAACVQGECVAGCANGLTVCGVAESLDGGAVDGGGEGAPICVDTSIDPNHCGSCGARCLDNQICTAGACVAAGTPAQGTTGCGFSADGGVILKNLQTDPANCGACGNVCAASEICQLGACDPCPVTQCNNVCVDTNTDVNNCGACGVVAPSCDDGTPRTAPVITALPPVSSGFLPVGASLPISVSVVSGIRLAEVTVVAKATTGGTTTTSNPLKLTTLSNLDLSPTVWSFTWSQLTVVGTTTPVTPPVAATTVELDFAAFDEQYRVERTDAANHTAALVVNTTVLATTPVAFNPTTITTTFAGDAGTAVPTASWLPLNGGAVVITATLASAPAANSGIIGIKFHSVGATDITLGGANPVIALSGATASITVNPNDLGVGARSIIADEVDLFGGLTSAPALVVTVGDVTPYTGITTNPILAHGTDGNDSIWLLGASATVTGSCPQNTAAHVFAQPYDQPVLGSTAIGSVVDNTSTFCTGTFLPTAELTGVYAVKSDGTSVARFDGVNAETATFITAPANTKFSHIRPLSVTGTAMAIDDSNNNGWFANATKGTGDPAPEEAGGADGGPFAAIVSVGADAGDSHDIGTSDAGADWGFVNVNTGAAGTVQYQLDIFHPLITGGAAGQTHIKSYLAAASSVPRSLSVFPGGEYVWEEVDTGGNLALGAGRFDGTDQPVDITNASVNNGALGTSPLVGDALGVGVANSLTSTAFFVPTPGVLVGLIPSKTPTAAGQGSDGTNRSPDAASMVSAGYEMVEIDLTQTPAKIYHPQTISLAAGVPVGQALLSGVTDRYGNFNTFTVSDDLKKVLYVTKAPAATGAMRDLYTINLLDLATGTVTAVYSSEYINNNDVKNNGGNGALASYPHFLHGMNSYAGLGASSTTPPIIIWAEELPVSNSPGENETISERLFYANYSQATIAANQIDRLAYASYDIGASSLAALGSRPLVAESVTADAIYFLSDDGGGALSLYALPFASGGTASQLVSKGVTNWELREDVGRQEVLRNDGTLLVGALAGNGPLSPVYNNGSGGMTDTVLLAFSGFTPDGNKLWTLVNPGQYVYQSTTSSGTSIFVDATLITIDLANADAQVNWGDSLSAFFEVGDPLISFLGPSANTLYGFDRTSNSGLAPRFFSSTAANPTAHSTVFATLPPPAIEEAQQTSMYSLDLNEALFVVNEIGGSFDLTTSPTNAVALPSGTTSLTLRGQAARVQPDLASFGPLHLPTWAIYDGPSTSGLTSNIFKQFGGATFQAPITIAAGNSAAPSVTNTQITPDFSQLLGTFADGSLPYVMKLPGPGVAAPATAPQ